MGGLVSTLRRMAVELFLRAVGWLSPGLRVRICLKVLERAQDADSRLRLHVSEAARLIEPEERVLIPSLERGRGPELDRFHAYQQHLVPFDIKDGDKVLDIGAGPYPFPYATHLADLQECRADQARERRSARDVPFQLCDLEHLPYRDQEFDFVYCSHVLEHVRDPARACEELMRVGKRGYVETPTRMSDIMLNFTRLEDHHRWHVNLLHDTLVFMEWTNAERRDTGIGEFYLLLHSKYRNPFQELFARHRDLFVNMLSWCGRFRYVVFDKQGRLMASSADVPAQVGPREG